MGYAMHDDDSVPPSSLGEMAALAQLWEEHHDKLLAMLRRRIDPGLSSRLDLEDLLSEAFIEARRKWPRFREQTAMTPYAWLYGVVYDTMLEAWRRHNRACRAPDRELPWPDRSSVQLGLGLVSPAERPSRGAAAQELQQQVQQALDQLPDRDREILWMRHHDELTFREAAAVLGIKEPAAHLRYVRALRRLKDLWQQLHGP
ncbi:MAG TPA: sigma-70 family RNA polymerase sigma factor [Pirellulales bacterium]|jgi:RNA polymerase sigma-70 factor (ECF subfamily)|nr:sigma-70 family RNA polymerase sigma factor [Pirellulales bacterium]